MKTSKRTLAIGDIHGCNDALDRLLDELALQPDDVVVMLGDAIDRGPDSRAVIERLLSLREQCKLIPILGNHEQMLLDARDGEIPVNQWRMYGGSETLDSYVDGLKSSEMEMHVEFIRTWGDYYETASHFFAHGNYVPSLPLGEQPWHLVRWESLRDSMPGVHSSGKTAVVGHTSQKSGEVLNAGHLVCIDTYCHGGGWLTAYEPETGRLWQSNEQGQLQEGELPAPR